MLQRWYDNHPDLYATPEFRRIKAVELSPQSLASEITITDADLHAAYDEHKAQYQTPGKRSAQVISVPDEAKAQALAAKWRDTPDWAAMQAAAKDAGAAAIAQDSATEVEFPDPDLAKAVFSAPSDQVVGPVKGALGWFVVKVTDIVPGQRDDVRSGPGHAADPGAGSEGRRPDVRPRQQAGPAARQRHHAG